MKLNRREFLQTSVGASLVTTILYNGQQNVFADDELKLKIVPITIKAGASSPFKAIHVSDSHFCFADARENERKRKLADSRRRYFSKGEGYFDAALNYAQKNKELFLHTGDLIDFVSNSNLEAIQSKLKDAFCFASSGNHEFSQYVGEAKEDAAYKLQSYDRVQKVYPNNITFASKVINNVNFIAFDDVYYNVTANQLAQFKAEVAKGLPIIAMCHCPLYTPELFDEMIIHRKEKSAYLLGAPNSKIQSYERSRLEQQKADLSTLDFLDWMKNQPLIKAILCGHLHFNWSGPYSKYTMQYVVGGNFAGHAYEITFE